MLSAAYSGTLGYVSMADLSPELFRVDSYRAVDVPAGLRNVQDQWMIPAEKFIWILPEYNGSFPGILKLFIDSISSRRREETFRYKKSMLVGIATGRSGNIRGMDHLSDILHHLKSIVFPGMMPISRVSELMDENGLIHHAPTLEVLEQTLKEFIEF